MDKETKKVLEEIRARQKARLEEIRGKREQGG
jgi:hypothetical protein